MATYFAMGSTTTQNIGWTTDGSGFNRFWAINRDTDVVFWATSTDLNSPVNRRLEIDSVTDVVSWD